MAAALIALLLCVPQDPPKVTYEDSGDFRLLVMDLERRFKGRVRFEKGIPSKEVSISVRDAGYYEALDALCRAHKESTYFIKSDRIDPDFVEGVRLMPEPWVDYPSVYSGHFKVVLPSMLRAVVASTDGNHARVDVPILLFAPPWIEVGRVSGTDSEWSLTEAVDAGGRDVLGPYKGEAVHDGYLTFDHRLDRLGNLVVHAGRLTDFDLKKGLKVLAGEATLKVPGYRVVRVAAETRAVAEFPQGTLTVLRVAKEEDGSRWTIAVRFKAKDGHSLKEGRVLASQVRYDGGSGAWEWLHLQADGFEVETAELARAPAWFEVKLLLDRRTIRVPFRFTDVVYKGE